MLLRASSPLRSRGVNMEAIVRVLMSAKFDVGVLGCFLRLRESAVNAVLPSRYYVHALISIRAIVVVQRAFAQGRTTNHELDVHARVVLLTRGAYIITLSLKLVQDPEVEILINLLRSTTKNDQIFADDCNLISASSSPGSCYTNPEEIQLASFLILILLLPVLLVAPTERDIRIINVMCVLDALPSGGQIPKTDDSLIHVVSDKVQKSNIVTPSDTIASLLSTVRGRNQFTLGLYMLLQPFLLLLTKSTTSALQSVLHVLFLPTLFKSNTRQGTDAPEECAIVNLRILSLVTADAANAQVPDGGELGGVHLGQAVWEGLESVLEEWENANPQGEERAGCDMIGCRSIPRAVIDW
ncbi:hypothetical protein BDR05DRAFT_977692 [Suillus weaverae]|nr:hypothetical protein BDR05DRAFT_977692 [Suillus weaverae]